MLCRRSLIQRSVQRVRRKLQRQDPLGTLIPIVLCAKRAMRGINSVKFEGCMATDVVKEEDKNE
jgi:hypothetical protein